MKFFKYIFLSLTILSAGTALAQKYNKQKADETLIKAYTVETNDELISYSVKVETTEINWVATEKSDKGKLNQSREIKPKKITKLISISSLEDPTYDNVLAMSYTAMDDDNLRIYPTAEGFAVSISGKLFTYNLIDREYYIDKTATDFFDVSSMDSE